MNSLFFFKFYNKGNIFGMKILSYGKSICEEVYLILQKFELSIKCVTDKTITKIEYNRSNHSIICFRI